MHKVKVKTLCELIGIKRITYYKKESGAVKFSLDEAKKISVFFALPIEEVFFANEVSKSETTSCQDSNATA